MIILTSQIEEKLKELLQDKRHFIEKFLKVKSKPKEIGGAPEVVPFILNPMQSDYWSKRTTRDINLKARQLGYTTVKLGEYFTDAITIPGLVVVVVSHSDYSTRRALETIKFFYDMLPEALQLPKKYDSSHELSFPDINSLIYIGTAGATRPFGRGDTVHRFLGTEVAQWYPNDIEAAENFLAGIEDAVPLTCNITLESTAFGEGGCFHSRYINSKQGLNPYKPFFYSWWWDRDYRIAEGSELALPADRGPLTLTAVEQQLMLEHNLDVEQIRFRRRKQAEKGKLFPQEYAEDDVTCFLTSGQSTFDREAIARLLLSAREPVEILDNGSLLIWQRPVAGVEYILAADPSEGNPNSDYSPGILIDRDCNHCATLIGRWQPRVLASKLVSLARMYNDAIIAPERNNHGHAVIDNILHTLSYSRIFYNRDLKGNIVDKPGWLTGTNTKSKMISEMDTALTAGIFRTSDKELLRQLRSLHYDNTKKLISTSDHDDLAMAAMIAVAANTILPHFNARVPSESYGI